MELSRLLPPSEAPPPTATIMEPNQLETQTTRQAAKLQQEKLEATTWPPPDPHLTPTWSRPDPHLHIMKRPTPERLEEGVLLTSDLTASLSGRPGRPSGRPSGSPPPPRYLASSLTGSLA